ncbi:MAG: hypothetical protein OCC45_00325 [Desulfotalea sp.]
MKNWEKAYSICAIIFILSYMVALYLYPQLRELIPLLAISTVGLLINIVFMFIILKNVLSNPKFDQSKKITWVALILVIWPMAIIYLVKHGAKKNTSIQATTLSN